MISLYEENVGPVKATIRRRLHQYVRDGVTVSLFREAVREVAMANSKRFNYLDAIVTRMQNEGARLVEP